MSHVLPVRVFQGAPRRSARRPTRRGIAALFAALLAPTALEAAPSLRVRGGSVIDASATALEGQVEVRGALRDDTGRPIGNASVRLKLLSREGSEFLPLPPGDACAPSPRLREERSRPGLPDEYVLDSDEAGGFCARLPGDISGSFELSFGDPGSLYDQARRLVPVDRERVGVDLVFAAPPSTLPLETPQHKIALEARLRKLSEVRPELALTVSIPERRWESHVVVRAGEATQLTVPSSALIRPGPVELVASYPGTDQFQPGEARLRTTATARVALRLSSPPEPARADEGIPLSVTVESTVGAVPNGAVEARIGNESVGIGRVEKGRAELGLRFEVRRERTVPVSLYYLASEPWWLAAEPLEVQVVALPPSTWGRWVWILALFGVGAWLVTGWWRPRMLPRPEKPATPPRRAPAARVQVLEAGHPHDGWSGIVRDAHDEGPIPDATVRLVRRGFDGEHELARVVTGPDGLFTLSPLGERGGAWLLVSARWHSSLEQALPPAGRLAIELVTRRRRLLGRLVEWANRHGKPWSEVPEPTPGHVAQIAGRAQQSHVSDWARAVEAAAYGPDAVDETVERSVLEREPVGGGAPSPHRNERSH